MKKMKQIVHTWMFGDSPLEENTASLARVGADGADLSITYEGRHTTEQALRKLDIQRIMADSGLKVMAVTPLYMHPDLELCHPDERVRQIAIDFSKAGADIAAQAGCDRMLISPSWISVRHQYYRCYEDDWKQAVDSLRIIAEYAGRQGVSLMIEPINRYRVSLVHTVEEGLRMMREVDMPKVGLVPDIFHMNMEEPLPLAQTLREANGHLLCLHIGDNNRKTPGGGYLDWKPILQAISDMDMEIPLSHEPVFLYFSEQKVAQDQSCRKFFEDHLANGIRHLNAVMEA